MTFLIWGKRMAVLAVLLAPVAARADTAEIEHNCTTQYPSITLYFAWKDCVKVATEREKEYELKRQEEDRKAQRLEAARPCLAADIPRMEALATKARAAINSETRLEDAQTTLASIVGIQGEITIPKDSIKEHVLVTGIDTRCDATFHFLINVREGSDKRLRWLRTWAVDAPPGYQAELHREFSAEFEELRDQERMRAEAAKFQEDLKARMAKEEQEREEQRQKLLRSVKISNVKMKCSGTCSFRTLEFVVTNISQRPVKRVSFGWMFLPPQMTECPAVLATKETEYMMVLQPGEKATRSIIISDAPENPDAKYCIRVTDLEVNYPWER